MADNNNEEPSLENVLYRVAALERISEKTVTDLYYGNGKPGLTTRVAMSENAIEKIGSNLSRMVWLAVATFLTVVGFVVEQTLKH